jgi:hypothetical protein
LAASLQVLVQLVLLVLQVLVLQVPPLPGQRPAVE